MRCGDCKYLGEEILIDVWDDKADDFQPDVPSGYHQCQRIKHCKNFDRVLEMQAQAVVVDGSGYYGAIRVIKDFGCVAFEPIQA